MPSREFEFDNNAICDICGKKEAYDIYGDFICNECIVKIEKKEEDDINIK